MVLEGWYVGFCVRGTEGLAGRKVVGLVTEGDDRRACIAVASQVLPLKAERIDCNGTKAAAAALAPPPPRQSRRVVPFL